LLLVALTGNIASGKSEVARIFEDLGATLIDADELAREAVRPGTKALAAIVARWGKRVLNADGTLNRGVLRSIVFADPNEREALNAIVHPEVGRRQELVADARSLATMIWSQPSAAVRGGPGRDLTMILKRARGPSRDSRFEGRLEGASHRRRCPRRQSASRGYHYRQRLHLEAGGAVERVWAELTDIVA
jgi:hypothetical protein